MAKFLVFLFSLSSLWGGEILFIASHPNALQHFMLYVQVLNERGIPARLLSSPQSEEEIYQQSAGAKLIVTDCGDPLYLRAHKNWVDPPCKRYLYYDNPDPYVPGGYSELFEEMKEMVDGILYANANLGTPSIGYYPVEKGLEIGKKRLSKKRNERELVLLIGSASPHFLERVLPHLEGLPTDSSRLLYYQKHPRAPVQGHFTPSPYSFEEALLSCDKILYYQTSTLYLFHLAGIPTCPINEMTSAKEWKTLTPETPLNVYQRVGYRENWKERLFNFVMH